MIRTARQGATPSLHATVLALSLSLAFAVALSGSLLLPWRIGESRGDSLAFARIYFLVFVPANFLAMNLLAIEQGRLAFRTFNVQRTVQAVAYPALLLLFWVGGFLNVVTAALSILGSTLVVALQRLWMARAGLLARPSLQEAAELVHIGWRLHLVDVFTHLAVQVDKMVLILFGGNAQLGLYVAAQTAGGAVQSLLIQTYINIMLPSAAGHPGREETGSSMRKLSVVMLLATVALIAALPWLIPLLFGEAFVGAAGMAQLLAAAAFCAGLRKALTYLLRSQGINRPSIAAEAVVALAISAGAYPVIVLGQATGLAALVLVAQCAGLVVMWRQFSRTTHCNLRDVFAA